MDILIEFVCGECGCIVACLFNEEEKSIEGPDQIDCPGANCSEVHHVYAKHINEKKADEFREHSHDPAHFW